MTTKLKFYSIFLLAASITLTGCQTITTASSKDVPQYENIRTMQAEIDSDGDGVLDKLDQCPNTPENVMVDDRGCPFTMPGVGLKMEYRAFFAKGSSELSKEYQLELDRVATKMKEKEYDTSTFRIEAHTSEDEINGGLNFLAKNRALMIKNYLLLKHQIDADRLSTFDCGADAPIASSDTEEGKAMNRRVYGLATEPEGDIAYNYPDDSNSNICIEF